MCKNVFVGGQAGETEWQRPPHNNTTRQLPMLPGLQYDVWAKSCHPAKSQLPESTGSIVVACGSRVTISNAPRLGKTTILRLFNSLTVHTNFEQNTSKIVVFIEENVT